MRPTFQCVHRASVSSVRRNLRVFLSAARILPRQSSPRPQVVRVLVFGRDVVFGDPPVIGRPVPPLDVSYGVECPARSGLANAVKDALPVQCFARVFEVGIEEDLNRALCVVCRERCESSGLSVSSS